MRKLSLNVESLSIQSFETSEAVKDARGTVHGHDPTRAGRHCNGDTSIADACVTGLCTFETCPQTFGPECA